MNCAKCGKTLTGKAQSVKFGERGLCGECVAKLESEPPRCPFCGTVDDTGESVALLLTRATATPAERLGAHTALVNVCPKCHGLYFDNFQFEILRMLKRS